MRRHSLLHVTTGATIILWGLGLVSCASDRSARAPVEVHAAPVPSEGIASPADADSTQSTSTSPSQVEKLEKALGALRAIPVPVRF